MTTAVDRNGHPISKGQCKENGEMVDGSNKRKMSMEEAS
jgi:hypothetical protein